MRNLRQNDYIRDMMREREEYMMRIIASDVPPDSTSVVIRVCTVTA